MTNDKAMTFMKLKCVTVMKGIIKCQQWASIKYMKVSIEEFTGYHDI